MSECKNTLWTFILTPTGILPNREFYQGYSRLNKLQPEVTNADRGKGCVSLIPLAKIDELYTKLKGYKVSSSLDLRSGYYDIGLSE